jgi:hypothetical protein
MRAKALKVSIAGSEPGQGWITVVGWGFVEKARHSRDLSLQALIEILTVVVNGHSRVLFREKICFARLNAPIVTTKLSIC